MLNIDVDVVLLDVPRLIESSLLDEEQLTANNVDDQLKGGLHGWKMLLTKKHGDLYITWDTMSPFLRDRSFIEYPAIFNIRH